MATISKLAVQLTANTGPFRKGLKNAGSAVGNLAVGVGKLGAVTGVAFGAAVAGAAAGLSVLVRRQFAAIDATAKFARLIGATTEELQGLRLAANITGTGTAILDKGLLRLQRTLGEAMQGVGEGRRALEKLGLSAEDLAAKSPVEALRIVARETASLSTNAEKAAVAAQLFGRAGQELGNLLGLTGKEMDELFRQTNRLGAAFNAVDAAKVEDANDAITRLNAAFQSVVREVTFRVAPAVDMIASSLTEGFVQFRERTIPSLIRSFAPFRDRFIMAGRAVFTFFRDNLETFGNIFRRTFNFVGNIATKAFGFLGVQGTGAIDKLVSGLAVLETSLRNVGLVAEIASTVVTLSLNQIADLFVNFARFIKETIVDAGKFVGNVLFDVLTKPITGKDFLKIFEDAAAEVRKFEFVPSTEAQAVENQLANLFAAFDREAAMSADRIQKSLSESIDLPQFKIPRPDISAFKNAAMDAGRALDNAIKLPRALERGTLDEFSIRIQTDEADRALQRQFAANSDLETAAEKTADNTAKTASILTRVSQQLSTPPKIVSLA